MTDILLWLEESALGRFMRDSSFWTYPLVNLGHIIGIASLFGSVLVLDLRLLGVWPDIPLASLSRPASRIARVAFTLAATTGVALLATQATEYAGNGYLLVKFPAIALALVNVALLSRTPAWQAHRLRPLTPTEHRHLAVCGGISLVCWTAAVTAGRLTAYW